MQVRIVQVRVVQTLHRDFVFTHVLQKQNAGADVSKRMRPMNNELCSVDVPRRLQAVQRYNGGEQDDAQEGEGRTTFPYRASNVVTKRTTTGDEEQMEDDLKRCLNCTKTTVLKRSALWGVVSFCSVCSGQPPRSRIPNEGSKDVSNGNHRKKILCIMNFYSSSVHLTNGQDTESTVLCQVDFYSSTPHKTKKKRRKKICGVTQFQIKFFLRNECFS